MITTVAMTITATIARIMPIIQGMSHEENSPVTDMSAAGIQTYD